MLPTASTEDAEGDLHDNELDPPLEEEKEESDQEDYTEFMPEELLHRLHKYKSVYYAVRCQRNDAKSKVVKLCDEHGELVHARDMQEEYLLSMQHESDSVKRNLEAYRQHTELQMNEESVVHQSKI